MLWPSGKEVGSEPMAPASDAFCWRLEVELYRLFDRVLFINEDECRIVEPLCPGRTVAVPPMMPWEGTDQREPASECAGMTGGDSFDLILVGSDAEVNVSGFMFFYYRIFVPYLRRRGITIAIVGKVCDHLELDDFYVKKLGEASGDLWGVYERFKVVIIPDFEGSGLSIKTIECLASGRAVVTSQAAARGLRRDPDSFLELDMAGDPAGTAEAILELLASEPKRTRMQRKARDYYRANFGAERYFSAMDGVLNSLGFQPVASASEVGPQ